MQTEHFRNYGKGIEVWIVNFENLQRIKDLRRFESGETLRSKNRQLSNDHHCEPQWGAGKRQTKRPFIPQYLLE